MFIRSAALCVLAALAFFGCQQPPSNGTGPEPRSTTDLIDTIRTGSYLNFAINETGVACYARLQELFNRDTISQVNVVANVFNAAGQLGYLIPRYCSVYLDESTGTGTGLQMYFKDDTVSALYLNSGSSLAQWPVSADTQTAIAVGNTRPSVISKLTYLATFPPTAAKFQRVSFLEKDLATSIDTNMLNRPEWYFGRSIGNDSIVVTHLLFTQTLLSTMIIDTIIPTLDKQK